MIAGVCLRERARVITCYHAFKVVTRVTDLCLKFTRCLAVKVVVGGSGLYSRRSKSRFIRSQLAGTACMAVVQKVGL